jgi:hypothetical protein
LPQHHEPEFHRDGRGVCDESAVGLGRLLDAAVRHAALAANGAHDYKGIAIRRKLWWAVQDSNL